MMTQTTEPIIIPCDSIPSDLAKEAEITIHLALERTTPVEKPCFIHTSGIPGSGKTTYANNWITRNHNFVLVQFDEIMEFLPGYRRDQVRLGAAAAFENWELAARNIGYHLLDRLVRSKRNIFFDHSAASRQHAILLQRVKEYGYRIEMHHIQCPLEEALERVRIRELICGRHTPEALVRERHELLLELLPIYRQTIDHSVSINTSSSVAVAQQHSAQSLGGFVP